jgi:hypothetical protein
MPCHANQNLLMVYKNQSSNKANEPSITTFLWFDPLYIFSSLQLQRGQKGQIMQF